MRALRDFNTPKIVTDDVPIFMGLIGDLFPALNVPRKRDLDFEGVVKKSVIVSTCQCYSHVCLTLKRCTCIWSCVYVCAYIHNVCTVYSCYNKLVNPQQKVLYKKVLYNHFIAYSH